MRLISKIKLRLQSTDFGGTHCIIEILEFGIGQLLINGFKKIIYLLPVVVPILKKVNQTIAAPNKGSVNKVGNARETF